MRWAFVFVVLVGSLGCSKTEHRAGVDKRVAAERLVRANLEQLKTCASHARWSGSPLLGDQQTLVVKLLGNGSVDVRLKDPDNDRSKGGDCIRGQALGWLAPDAIAGTVEVPVALSPTIDDESGLLEKANAKANAETKQAGATP